jgi:hypothetical protein
MRTSRTSDVNRRLLITFVCTSVLLLALVLVGCGGEATESGGIADRAVENLEDNGVPLASTTPGRPALVEFYADW